MQKVFELSNKYIILATLLILFTIFSKIYLLVMVAGGKIINIIFGITLFFLMSIAFFSGWFNLVKLAIHRDSITENPNSIIKEFVSSVGEFFLPYLGLILVSFIFFSSIMLAFFFVGKNIIGNPGITIEELSKAMQSTDTIRLFLANLEPVQIIKINLWNMLLMLGTTLGSFLLFLYIPALFYKNKNPFIAFFISIKDLFSKNFLKTAGIFLLLSVTYTVLSIFTALFGGILIIHLVTTLLNFYFVVFVSIAIFYYYNITFVKPKIGQNIDLEI